MRWIVLFLFFALFISPHADCLAGDFVSLKVSSPSDGKLWSMQRLEVWKGEEAPEGGGRLVGYLFCTVPRDRWNEEKWLKNLQKAAVTKMGGHRITIRKISSDVSDAKKVDVDDYTVRVYRDDPAVVSERVEGTAPKDPRSPRELRADYGRAATKKERKECLAGLRAWAEGDSPEGCLYYGRVLMERAGSQEERFKAAQWFFRAYERGNREAAFDIGELFGKGMFARSDWREAAGWYQKAAEAGVAQACYRLGYDLWRFGRTEEEKEQTLIALQKGAELGDCDCAVLLGQVRFFRGSDPKQFERCFKDLWVSYGKGCGDALNSIRFGLVRRDLSMSLKRKQFDEVTRRAKRGDHLCELRAGVFYLNGFCVAPDARTAFSWMKKAAENGVAEAQYALSGMYKNGTGVEKDDLRSLYWLEASVKNGYDEGKEELLQMRVGKNGSEDPNGGGSGKVGRELQRIQNENRRARDDRAVAEPRGILFGR